MTISEIFDIEQNGVNTIKIKKNINSIQECIDDYTGFFVATKRVEPLLNEMSGDYVAPLKRAVALLKVYEDKSLNEGFLSGSGARILVYDVNKFLKEAYNKLMANKRMFNEMDKENISKVFSSLMFEVKDVCDKYDIMYENIIENECLFETVSDDMAYILNEVF